VDNRDEVARRSNEYQRLLDAIGVADAPDR